jgi:hypothetical protein
MKFKFNGHVEQAEIVTGDRAERACRMNPRTIGRKEAHRRRLHGKVSTGEAALLSLMAALGVRSARQ